MRGRVIVNSFHSSSVKFIENCSPETIISFDSHADTVLCGVTGRLLAVAEGMPRNVRNAILRPSVHMLMRRHMPKSKIFVVIPLTCLVSATTGEYRRGSEMLHSDGLINISSDLSQRKAIDFQKLFIEKILKMRCCTSPPNSLKKLAQEVRGQKVVIDIDVDYMADCQGECYTMAPGLEIKDGQVVRPRKSDLGSSIQLLRFIKLTKPAVITLSEARLIALKTLNTSTGRFLKALQGLHYEIEYGELLSSDKKACDLMDRHEDFVNTRVCEIQRKYVGSSSDEKHAKEEDEIAKAMKQHFTGRH